MERRRFPRKTCWTEPLNAEASAVNSRRAAVSSPSKGYGTDEGHARTLLPSQLLLSFPKCEAGQRHGFLDLN